MKSVVINLLIAGIWLLLSPDPSIERFAIGFLLGWVVLFLFAPLLASESYIRRGMALARFLVVFVREFVVANINVVWIVLFRSRHALNPNFIRYSTRGMRPGEILLLTYCISLTPGSTTVEVSDDFETLILHVLDANDPHAVRARIDAVLKSGILSFTR